ncbi:MAG: WecB/TagA/CpsF family glycosyltransferase [Planctomycetota bacterium]
MLGLELRDCTLSEAADAISLAATHQGLSQVVSFVNAHCYNVARRSDAYRRALRAATWLLPDGTGVRWAAKLFGHTLRANPNGTDLFPLLCDRAETRGHRLFFFGAKPGVADRMARALKITWPDLLIAGTWPGDFQPGKSGQVIEAIRVTRPDILFVAGGVPLQELWIEQYRPHLEVPMILGVGGLFDFYAREVSRAPSVLRRSGLEWTWRLLQEPQRLGRRYLLGNPDFLIWILSQRLGKGGGVRGEPGVPAAPLDPIAPERPLPDAARPGRSRSPT